MAASDRVGPSRSRELDFVVKVSRLQDDPVKRAQKFDFGTCDGVQGMLDTILFDIGQQRLFRGGVVVSVIQRARATEEVDKIASVRAAQNGSRRAVENGREESCVSSHRRFDVGNRIVCGDGDRVFRLTST